MWRNRRRWIMVPAQRRMREMLMAARQLRLPLWVVKARLPSPFLPLSSWLLLLLLAWCHAQGQAAT